MTWKDFFFFTPSHSRWEHRDNTSCFFFSFFSFMVITCQNFSITSQALSSMYSEKERQWEESTDGRMEKWKKGWRERFFCYGCFISFFFLFKSRNVGGRRECSETEIIRYSWKLHSIFSTLSWFFKTFSNSTLGQLERAFCPSKAHQV